MLGQLAGDSQYIKDLLLPEECKHCFNPQLHRKQVVAVGWELQNRKIDLCAQINLKQYQLTALKHTYQLRGMGSTLRMRTTMSPKKGETAVHGCHCRGDMVVRMRKVLTITRSWYVCFNAVNWYCF